MPPSEADTPLLPEKAGNQVAAAGAGSEDSRTAEVWSALATVLDPELDESIVELGFIARVAVESDRAEVDFRLPTFWCSASFAWIMAEDMRAALAALPWLARADVRLVDHFAAGKVNDGVAAGRGFREAFGGEAAADLAGLRETFRRKAYLGRMSRLIEALRERGWSDARILSANIDGLRAFAAGAADADTAFAAAAARFLELRSTYGGPSGSSEVAFRHADGVPVAPDGLVSFLRDIRMTRRGVEANGEMCRVLLKARIADPAPAE
jgi:metal-sulfur cluster biosynthetic enzyme